MNNKKKKWSFSTIAALVLFVISILVLLGLIIKIIILVNSNEYMHGEAVFFSMFFALIPIFYYFGIFLLFRNSDKKGNIINKYFKFLVLWGPIICIGLKVGIDNLSGELNSRHTQTFKNVKITFPSDLDWRMGSGSGSEPSVWFVNDEGDLYCWLGVKAAKNTNDFHEGFKEKLGSDFNEYSLIDVDIKGKDWAYYNDATRNDKIYGLSYGRYFYYLYEDTDDDSKDYCDKKFEELLNSIEYKD